VRQISVAEVRRPLEPIAEVAHDVRVRLEAIGIAFVEDDDPGLPGPSQTAAVELASGLQFAFEHFYTHQASSVTVRAELGASPPRRLDELRAEFAIESVEVLGQPDDR
jgi:hypothetical protein